MVLDVLSELTLLKIQAITIASDTLLSTEDVQLPVALSPEWFGFMIRFLMSTGIRISELINILVKNVRKQQDIARIRILGKVNKERIAKESYELIIEIKQEFKGKTWLFEDPDGNQFRREMRIFY